MDYNSGGAANAGAADDKLADATGASGATIDQISDLSRQRYESFFAHNLDAVFTVDPSGNFTDANPQAEQLSGYTTAELRQKSFMQLCSPESLERAVERFKATLAGDIREISITMIRRDGRRVPLRLTGSAIVIAGKPAEVCVVARDLSQQLQVEQALKENELLFKGTFENAAVGIAHVAADGRFLRVNQKLCQITGYDLPELMAKTYQQITHADDVEADNDLARQLWAGQICSYSLEKRYIRKDGGTVWIGLTGTVHQDHEGRPEHFISVVQDITQRKQYERALLEARDDLERRVNERTIELQQRATQLARLAAQLTRAEQRERRRLAAVLHDDLQQLLVAARMHIQMLRQDESAPARRESLDAVYQIIGDAIDASRTLTHDLDPPVLHQAGLVPGLEWLVRTMSEKHRLTVMLNVDDEVRGLDEEISLLLFQAVRELLMNVVRHAQVTLADVRLDRPAPQQVSITVSDSGRGFQVQQALQDDNAGFGLFAIQERIALMGGKVDIWSKPDKGTRVTVIVPLSRKSQQGAPELSEGTNLPATNQAREAQAARQSGLITLLIVDDHAIMRQGLAMLLSGESDIRIVGEAADGEQAVQQARRLQPDIILMDYSMPVMNGTEATKIIRQELPQTRVIALSMFREADRAPEMLAAGAVAYVTKTGKNKALLNIIRNVFDGNGDGNADRDNPTVDQPSR